MAAPPLPHEPIPAMPAVAGTVEGPHIGPIVAPLSPVSSGSVVSHRTTPETDESLTTPGSASPSNDLSTSANPADAEIVVPEMLRVGVPMLKVSAKKIHQRLFALNAERGQITWESKKGGVCNIESIREMRFAAQARDYRVQFKISAEHEARWMSIVYLGKGKYKMLHCVALTDDVFAAWKETLVRIFELRRALLGGLNHMRKRQMVWLKQHWTEADSSGDSKLDFPEVLALCRRLNISAATTDIKAHFKIADSENNGYLDFAAFQRFVKLMKRRADVETLFKELTSGRDELDGDEWIRFLKDTQKSTLDDPTLLAIYHKFADETSSKMTIEGFATFLQSTDNAVFAEPQTNIVDDMKLPLWDYFISSSHNTYLVGNQLKGASTVEGYIRALQQGARSVELDVWDGDGSEPVVYHGRTLTSKIPVSDVLNAIAKYAFVASPYPVILSVEVHCERPQQEVLAQLFKSCLGSALVVDRLEGDSDGPIEQLPSPEDLKYRILLKAKNRFVDVKKDHIEPQDTPADIDISTESSASSDTDFKRLLTNASNRISVQLKRISSGNPATMAPPAPSPPLSESRTPPDSATSVPSIAGRASLIDSNGTNTPPLAVLSRGKKPPMSFALAGLLVYTVGVKARGFNKLTRYAPEHVVSLGERTCGKLQKQAKGADVISHTRGHLTRAYPSGTRVTSSNYLPNQLWAMGVQMAACNWQTFDLGMEINSAFFSQNGRCGYVLKPEALRLKSKDKEAATRQQKFVLDISIISGQQLPKIKDDARTVDPSVEVAVVTPGSGYDGSQRRRTKVIKGNGFNPIFNEPFRIPFEAPGGMLDLCFVRIVVHDGGDDDVQLGRYCISTRMLQPGYRQIPLYDELGQQFLFASLFIRSSITPVGV